MKFKVVGVYSGYNEMSIDGVVLIIWGKNDIEDLVNECFKALKHKFIDNDELEVWNEFSSKGVISEDIGYYGCDEEGFNLVIGQYNSWYDRLNNYKDWSDSEYEEWKEFCNSIA